ncbi:aldehyde dehydrogenase family protein [Umezawaea sp. Da 62-37]|uniref:aldehyde dehydrogenase family protein n=1 Tax=Umezawaea sp. Da 62-37 TaxID=3075927 RepID=UPI0028F6FF0F|nr:aldehyde dehydrogenase family protein [Umezawaea sp. Da 62-37]WNV89043.1 aldehyde dehydrogenase family protein [Umezawaea sp. Da 62-37]
MTRLVSPAASGPNARDVVEPATGDVLGQVVLSDAEGMRASIAEASAAQPSWAATPPADRAAVLRRAAQVLEEHTDEVVEWLVRESGSLRARAGDEVGAVLDELWVASALPTQPHGELLTDPEGRQSLGRRAPLGVVGVISPWNVPLLLGMRAVAPALALGNAVVLKPDPHTQVSGGHVLAALFERAGLPDGVLRVVGGDAEVGRALTGHPDVRMIAFTGSTAVGRRIGAEAGRDLKRVSLELGGTNAIIVLDDADLDLASSAGAAGSFVHQGRAAGRHIVLRAVADEYADRLTRHAEKLVVGDPWRDDVALGPLIDAARLERVDRIVRDTVSAGARLRTGGTHDGLCYRPTVLTGVTSDMPAFADEIFGPVAPVIVVADEDEAVEVANRTGYGLVAAVQTGSVERGLALAGRLATGVVHINDRSPHDSALAPFGGWGAAGGGRNGSGRSWDEFTQWRWLTVRTTAIPGPQWTGRGNP